MTIDDLSPKIKSFFDKPVLRRFIMGLGLVLLMTVSFGLGKLSIVDQKDSEKQSQVAIYLPEGTRYNPNREEEAPESPKLANLASFQEESSSDAQVSESHVFASKNGKNYYFVGCAAGNRIKEENKVWFDDPDKAEAAGYTQSTQCK